MKATWLLGSALCSVLVASCGAQSEAPPGATETPEEVAPASEPAAATPHAPSRPRRANGTLAGVQAYRGNASSVLTGPIRTQATPQCNNPKLSYFGGPIVQTPQIVAVFWSSHVNAALTAPTTGIGQFYADVTQSSYWTWLQEYNTVGLTNGSEQTILPGTFFGQVTLMPSRCAGTTACTVTDAQIQTELASQIAGGALPAPTLDCTGNVETIYMINFPPNVKVTGPDGAGNSCSDFCAYHNTGTYGAAKTPVIYGVLMDEFTAACAQGCGNAGSGLKNSTNTASHELVETVTDPDIGLDLEAQYAAPAAWGDNSGQCGEIADICDDGGAGDTITVNGRTWSVQDLWSNKQGKCTATGTALPVCSGTTLTNCRKCSCGDSGNACSGATSVCEGTKTNVLFGACEACTATSGTCTAGATCQQSTTAAQDDICIGACVPKTTCPTGDDCGTVSDGCGGMITCGTCTGTQTCGGGGVANQCGGGTCVPATSCPTGANCGTLSNGCGGMITCGTCTGTQTCGGGGVANQCGGGTCVPKTTCPTGDNCGTVSDGCGGMINCGTCTGTQTCGGGGVANQCGSGTCVPATSCPAGLNCGNYFDGCTGIINCGTCTAPQTCGGGAPSNANVCGGGCVPATTCPAGDDCGAVTDGCGGVLECGTCAAPQTCGGGTPSNPNQCGCTAATSCPAGDSCGTVSDGCGGMLDCGTCGAGQTCSGNECVSTTTSSSSSGTGGSTTTATSSSSGTGGTTTTTTTTTTGTGGSTTTTGSATGGATTTTGSATGGATTTTGTATTTSGTGGTGGGSLSFTTGSGGGGGGAPTTVGAGGDTSTTGTAGGSTSTNGGCSCKSAGDQADGSTSSLSALGLLMVAGVVQTRRRRRTLGGARR